MSAPLMFLYWIQYMMLPLVVSFWKWLCLSITDLSTGEIVWNSSRTTYTRWTKRPLKGKYSWCIDFLTATWNKMAPSCFASLPTTQTISLSQKSPVDCGISGRNGISIAPLDWRRPRAWVHRWKKFRWQKEVFHPLDQYQKQTLCSVGYYFCFCLSFR